MKLKATLPKGDDAHYDGLSQFEQHIDKTAEQPVIIIAVFDPEARTQLIGYPYNAITLKLRHIEMPRGIDRETVEEMLQRLYQLRTGKTTLDFGSILDETLSKHAGDFLPEDTTVSWADPKTGEVKTRKGRGKTANLSIVDETSDWIGGDE